MPDPAGVASFKCKFTCFPADTQFRPPRITKRPFVHGPQTAIVTGCDTVDTDQYGRVKVKFHWDEEENDENRSCWIRVSQAWAGNCYGSVLLPHVGQEVIVSFLEGDPDRPMITGRVYNADNMPPETVPDHDHRAIVAWDEAGNYIALDADKERIDINNANKFEYTDGTSATATAGQKFEITVGCDVGINVGASVGIALAGSFDVSAGWSTSIFIGGSWSASYGNSYTFARGSFVNAGDSLGQIAFKEPADFVSQERVRLAGGSGIYNSVVNAESEALSLSYGETVKEFKNASGSYWGTFMTAVLGTVGVGAASAGKVLEGSAAQEDDATGLAEHAEETFGAGVGAAVLAVLLTGAFAAYWKRMTQPLHEAPLGSITLSGEGVRIFSNRQKAINLNGGRVVVRSTEEAVIGGGQVTVEGNLRVSGQLSTGNIQDVGNALAAAAAEQRAVADHQQHQEQVRLHAANQQ